MVTCELFVEGCMVKPQGLAVLRVLETVGAVPSVVQTGVSVREIAERIVSGQKVVRARLCELRAKGLVGSGLCPDLSPAWMSREYGHYLTETGVRRLLVG
jgi:hypothetical protein